MILGLFKENFGFYLKENVFLSVTWIILEREYNIKGREQVATPFPFLAVRLIHLVSKLANQA